ncbi:SseB family protein [Phaeovulum sp. W22_SRMD_FR3]|uniref:SseB family protein n=1 Tax=Phaeovulum sp. W22_SRMD_FR3 TaxID=3240274 RepID=UPI003F9B3367
MTEFATPEHATPFDLAHAAMEAAPEEDGARLALYHLLADTELYLLLEVEPEDADITPQVFETEEGDFVMAFDLEERLAEFAGMPAPYAALPGRVIAEKLVGHEVGLGINLGVANSAMLLPPEALEWLAETLTQAPEAASGRPVAFHPPALGPGPLSALLTAFQAKFTHLAGLASHALLAGVTYEGGGRGHILAFLGAAPQSEPALAKAVGEALTFSGLEAAQIDVTFITTEDPAAEAILKAAQVIALPEPVSAEAAGDTVVPKGPGMDPTKPPILR